MSQLGLINRTLRISQSTDVKFQDELSQVESRAEDLCTLCSTSIRTTPDQFDVEFGIYVSLTISFGNQSSLELGFQVDN